MFSMIPQSVRNFIDSIFAPPLSWLQVMEDMLSRTGQTVGKGINLNNYFSFFGYMPQAWQALLLSLISSCVLLAILFVVKAGWNMYLRTKESTQWW